MNWPRKKLGEVIEFLPKSSRKAGDGLKEGLFQFFSSSQVQDKFINEVDYKDEAIILGTGGSPSVHIAKSFSASADTFTIKGRNKDLANKFLYYFLMSEIETLKSGFKGAALKHLSKEYLKLIEIPLPLVAEQRRIVKGIEKLFAKIDEAQKLREESKKSAYALFQSALNKIFTGSKSQKWEEKELKKVCQKTEQGHPQKFFNDSFHYIDISSIDNEQKKIEAFSTYSVNQAPSRARKLIKARDILFATTRPYLENIAFVNSEFDNKICSTGFCVVRADQKIILPEFLFFVVTSKQFIDKVLMRQRGATYPAVSDNDIFNIKIPLPSIVEQKKIVAYFDSLSEKVRKLQDLQQKTADDFKNLKKSILSKAFKVQL